jgi:hypothetical protein
MSDLIGQISSRSALVGVQEHGNNSNGYYIKYKDGFMLCYKEAFQSQSGSEQTWTFPHAFASGSKPTVAGTSSDSEKRWCVPGSNGSISNTSWGLGALNAVTSFGGSAGSVGFSTSQHNLSAIGRWY